MKPFKMNKWMAIGLALFVAVILFIVGKGQDHHGAEILTGAAVVSLTEEEKTAFNENEQKVVLAMKKYAETVKAGLMEGRISKDEVAAMVNAVKGELKTADGKTLQEEFKRIEQIAKTQGTTLQELSLKMNGVETGNKSIGQVMEENKDELRKIYVQGSGSKTFMINVNHKGQFVAKPFDATKAVGPHGTIDAIESGTVSSITESIDAASLLRLGGAAPIISQYRNTPWVFDLCNLVNAGFEMPLAMYYEEQAKDGASAAVLEGGTKPSSQYKYDLITKTYKKEAVLLGFTEEFQLDFARLQSDILGKGRVDLINRINTAILARIVTAATAYNTSANFGTVPDANDFDAIAAMAAQVDNATFGANANAAITSTFKKYGMGVLKDGNGMYLNRPRVLDNINFVGNPAMGDDDVLVGDMKQYNILLRGGLIVRVGYNGTDFAENRFSTVLEQFYFDYISAVRAVAIVKGTTFATVKTAIAAP